MNLIVIYKSVLLGNALINSFIGIAVILIGGVIIGALFVYLQYKYTILPVRKFFGLPNSIFNSAEKQAITNMMPKHKTLALILAYLFVAIFVVVVGFLEVIISKSH